MAKANGSKAVAETKDQLPAHLQNMKARGSENVETSDIALPRIDVIQDLSPQHKENKPEYIPGAKVGMLFNTLTAELFPEGVNVVPVYFDKQYLVWRDQKKGGGLKGVFSKAEREKGEALAEELGDGHECVETPTHIVLVVDDEGNPRYEATIPMPKSKMKANKGWNSLITLNGGDRFSRVYRMVSVLDSNSEGQEYMNFKFANVGYVNEATYKRAENLYETIASGRRQVAASYAGESADDDEAAY